MLKFFLTTWRFLKSPQFVISTVGLAAFLAEYFFKPISYVGLALLGFVIAPWIIQVLHKLKIGGVELELKPASIKEREENIKNEIEEAESSLTDPKPQDANSVKADKTVILEKNGNLGLGKSSRYSRERFIIDETKILNKIGSNLIYPLRQQVKLGPFYVDGIIERPDWHTLIEVKLLYSTNSNLIQIDHGAKQLTAMIAYHNRNAKNLRVDGLLAIGVAMDDSSPKSRLRQKIDNIRNTYHDIEVTIFDIS